MDEDGAKQGSPSGPALLAAALAVVIVAVLGWLVFGPSAPDADSDEPATADCDPKLSFSPDPPLAGSALSVVYAHGEPLKYVDLKVTGPVYPGVRLEDLALEDRANWSWSVTALEPGKYRFEVWGGKPSTRVAVCEKRVEPAK